MPVANQEDLRLGLGMFVATESGMLHEVLSIHTQQLTSK